MGQTSEDKQFRAQDAHAVLNSDAFKSAFTRVGEYLEARAVGCDPDNKDLAQRIILSKQILTHIKRELVRVIEDAELDSIKLETLEEKKGLFRKLRR